VIIQDDRNNKKRFSRIAKLVRVKKEGGYPTSLFVTLMSKKQD